MARFSAVPTLLIPPRGLARCALAARSAVHKKRCRQSLSARAKFFFGYPQRIRRCRSKPCLRCQPVIYRDIKEPDSGRQKSNPPLLLGGAPRYDKAFFIIVSSAHHAPGPHKIILTMLPYLLLIHSVSLAGFQCVPCLIQRWRGEACPSAGQAR